MTSAEDMLVPPLDIDEVLVKENVNDIKIKLHNINVFATEHIELKMFTLKI